MTLDELIAIMEYKAKNIKAHISPSVFEQIAEILKGIKKEQE